MDLDLLFKDDNVNPKCEGCPILKKNLREHCILDYEGGKECDILFVSDSPKMFEGDYVPFRPNEYALIMRELERLGVSDRNLGFTTASKCPSMNMDVMPAKARRICRQHLVDTIKQYNPDLIFACGQLATNMFYGRAKKDTKIRGKVKDIEMEEGSYARVVSIIHPWQVISEPKNQYLFSKDLENSINKEILTVKPKISVPYDILVSKEDLDKHLDFYDTKNPISLDVETTGLNFLEDIIHTVSISMLDLESFNNGEIKIEKTVVVPIDHREAKLGVQMKALLMEFVVNALKNKRNRKILQNSTFDTKFLKRYGVEEIYNIWDTKIMQHLKLEDVPKSLEDLVYYYFPDEV